MTSMDHARPRVETDSQPNARWYRRAACREEDPEIFFPVFPAIEEMGTPNGVQALAAARADQAEAKAVCGVCDVRAQCLAEALEKRWRGGIFGGLTERERRELLRGAA